jgi:hypothetical protein
MSIWLGDEALRLAASLPQVRRARGARLYTNDGRRLLDLWAEGGRMLSGRRRGGADLAAVEQLDRGLASAFASPWQTRLEKSLCRWLPGFGGFEFFSSETEALLAIAEEDGLFIKELREGRSPRKALGDLASRTRRVMPLDIVADERSEMLHACCIPDLLPDCQGHDDMRKMSAVLSADAPAMIMLPLPEALSFGAIARKKPGGVCRKEGSSPAIPAMKLAAAARAVCDLLAFIRDFDRSRWAAIDSCIEGLFVRQGPWLIPCYGRTEHAAVFADCLAHGVLISPEYRMPSCVPAEFDAGEAAVLKQVRRP